MTSKSIFFTSGTDDEILHFVKGCPESINWMNSFQTCSILHHFSRDTINAAHKRHFSFFTWTDRLVFFEGDMPLLAMCRGIWQRFSSKYTLQSRKFVDQNH